MNKYIRKTLNNLGEEQIEYLYSISITREDERHLTIRQQIGDVNRYYYLCEKTEQEMDSIFNSILKACSYANKEMGREGDLGEMTTVCKVDMNKKSIESQISEAIDREDYEEVLRLKNLSK